LAGPERIETLIIGGGQAGLVMSHMLSKRGRPHLVLERHRIAERWRTERWDGLYFQFPNWSVGLPDFPFPHDDPEGFAGKDEIIAYIEAYAAFIKPPLRTGVTVTSLRRRADGVGFITETSEGSIESDNVVVATGPYQRPKLPDVAGDTGDLFQVHASRYANPQQLPPGAVVVVGAGASGAQIAEELMRAGRRVYLAVGQHRRLPRRYRGRDFRWWMQSLRRDQLLPADRGPRNFLSLVITGAYGGHTVDFRNFAAAGITLTGHFTRARDGVLHFADDLADNLKAGDAVYRGFLDMADAYVAHAKLAMPPEPEAHRLPPDPPALLNPPRLLDIRGDNIGAIVWATGYALDFGWIDLPVFQADGEPIHQLGVTEVPGLYFLGLLWLSGPGSSFLSGVSDDATRLADHLVARALD
jgi:putative flavoprotein involved in K+ transport